MKGKVRSVKGQRNKSFEASDVLINSKVVKSKEKFHTAFSLSVGGSSAKSRRCLCIGGTDGASTLE